MIFFPPSMVSNDLKFNFSGSLNERYESRIYPNFGENLLSRRTDLGTQVRLKASFHSKMVDGEVSYQYRHDLIWTSAKNFSNERSDVYTAFVNVDKKLKVGRQTFALDNGRLIGDQTWNLVGRSYNGASIDLGRVKVLAGQLAVNDNTDNSIRLGAASLETPLGTSLYAFKHTTRGGGEDVHTVYQRLTHKIGEGLNVNLEGSGQKGRVAGRDQEAWAGIIGGDFALNATASVFAEYVSATGGVASNGRVETFDPLFPDAHEKYGLSDLQGLANTNTVSAGVHIGSGANKFTLAYHKYQLRSATDAWYNAIGGVNAFGGTAFLDPTGAAGKDVGEETDVVFKRKSSAGDLSLGVGLFKPGAYVKSLVGSGVKNQSFGFIQCTFRF